MKNYFTLLFLLSYCIVYGQATNDLLDVHFITLCADDSIQINAEGNGQFTWSPTEGLSNPNISNPIITSDQDI